MAAPTTTKPNLLDRLIGSLNPQAGLRRMQARRLLARAYEGASRADGWNPRRAGASANADHAADARELRVRARALVKNVPYIAQGLRSLTANIVGNGIIPTWTGANAEVLNTLWKRWEKEADSEGHRDIYGIQAAAYRAMEQDGEVLIRFRHRLLSDGLAVPLQLQVMEIDWLDSDKNAALPTGGHITNGIEYDPLGRVTGYWLYVNNPGDAALTLRGATRESYRVPATEICHLFTPERPGAGRGFTRLAPVIATVRDLSIYEDAELARKNLESRLGVIGSGDIELLGDGGASALAANAAQEWRTVGNGGTDLGELPSGGIMQVPAGTALTVVKPEAMPGYVEYVKHKLHIIAAGWGVTYEMMTGDVSEVSYSSARVRMLDFRREAEMTQWTVLIPKLCERICREFENAAVLAGRIKRPLYQIEHSTPKWAYVDPIKEIKADLAEVGGGMSSISEKLRQRGYQPDDVFRELADDVRKLREYGVLDALALLRSTGARQDLTSEIEEPKKKREPQD